MKLTLNPDGSATGAGTVNFRARFYVITDPTDLFKIPDTPNGMVFYNSNLNRFVGVAIESIDNPDMCSWAAEKVIDFYTEGEGKKGNIPPAPFSLILNKIFVFRTAPSQTVYLYDFKNKMLVSGIEVVEAYLQTEGHGNGISGGCVHNFAGVGPLDVILLFRNINFLYD